MPFEADAPHGFRHQSDFITEDEEARLAAGIETVQFAAFEMRGVAARRRVAFFGSLYDSGAVAPPLPPFLIPLRDAAALWSGVDPVAFEMALINEYPPGAPIGWHRDAPQYGLVAGISLLSSCRMKFRPYVRNAQRAPAERRVATHQILLEPRSVYLLTGDARQEYEHHIPGVPRLRYSITFRTVRR